MSNPVYNRPQFEVAIERLVRAADAENRGGDLDRVVAHVDAAPQGVSALTSLTMLLDDDVRPEVTAAVEAYRRFGVQKGEPLSDDGIVEAMRAAYRRVRAR